MIRYRPSSLLLLLLALCLLDASFTSTTDYNPLAAAYELEEGFQEGMDDLLEEEISFGTDLIDFVFCALNICLPSDTERRLTGVCKRSSSLCSFGWLLPLRV